MVQFINLPETGQSKAAGQIGAGLGRNLYEQGQYNQQKSRLKQAFGNLQKGGSFLQNLEAVGPDLLSVPGGSQLLAELAPVLRQDVESRNAEAGTRLANEQLNQFKTQQGPGQQQPQAVVPEVGQTSPSVQAGTIPQSPEENAQPQEDFPGENNLRYPNAQGSQNTLFPSRNVNPQPLPELSPQDKQNLKAKFVLESRANGKPVTPSEADAFVDKLAMDVQSHNSRLKTEQTETAAAQATLTNGMVDSMQKEKLINNTPTDRAVVQKFALEARDKVTEGEQFNYVKSRTKEYDDAKNGIMTVGSLDNHLMNAVYNKPFGVYKAKEQIRKDIQKSLPFMKEHGLIDEARNLIADSTGFGAIDTEATLFPMGENQKKYINETFKPNGQYQERFKFGKLLNPRVSDEFPGEEAIMPETEYLKFKEDVLGTLQKYPKTNLVTLSSDLNQGKKYAWQDVNKAYNELIAEKRWTPDGIQRHQLNIVQQPPMPGLGKWFDFLWKDTK